MEIREEIRRRLREFIPRKMEQLFDADAAVLMPVFERRGKPYFLLTLRTNHVATHKGQISFPGGLQEPADADLCETALREAQEEVGIPPALVDVLGEFQPYLAVTRWRVTPFVGFLEEGFELVLNPREVEAVLEVPFEFFRTTEPTTEVHRPLGQDVLVHFYNYQGHTIWGLTARMIKDFLEEVFGK